MSLLGMVDTLDVQLDKVQRLVTQALADDPELATQREELHAVQDGVDKTAAAAEQLDAHLRDVARSR